ncbi:unnamed protein product [Rotaria sp. Silwood1]|nr:unnamed protein product [Rotaria sp. Silwood1]
MNTHINIINLQLRTSIKKSYELINDQHTDTYYNSTLMQQTTVVMSSRSKIYEQPIESPMRCPHSSSNNELSENESFMKDPNTKLVHNHKQSRINANIVQQPPTTTAIFMASTNNAYRTTVNESITIEAEHFAQSKYPFPPRHDPNPNGLGLVSLV